MGGDLDGARGARGGIGLVPGVLMVGLPLDVAGGGCTGLTDLNEPSPITPTPGLGVGGPCRMGGDLDGARGARGGIGLVPGVLTVGLPLDVAGGGCTGVTDLDEPSPITPTPGALVD